MTDTGLDEAIAVIGSRLGVGIMEAITERRHQIEDLGYTAEHDLEHHTTEDLLNAGKAYVETAWSEISGVAIDSPPYDWPRSFGEFMAKDNVFENLEIGMAFLAACYDRFSREVNGGSMEDAPF